jgi:hypothetical protein
VVITVATDRADDARSWIERANPTHPTLIDEHHRLGELYNMVNVPTVVWIDETGRITRPNDVAFTTEKGGRYANVSTDEQMALLRGWVRGSLPPPSDDDIRKRVTPLSEESSLARAHFGLGWWLHQEGRFGAAQHQFSIGGELAPDDFMIRRGTMPLRGSDPFGPEFAEMVTDWLGRGHTYYLPLPVE